MVTGSETGAETGCASTCSVSSMARFVCCIEDGVVVCVPVGIPPNGLNSFGFIVVVAILVRRIHKTLRVFKLLFSLSRRLLSKIKLERLCNRGVDCFSCEVRFCRYRIILLFILNNLACLVVSVRDYYFQKPSIVCGNFHVPYRICCVSIQQKRGVHVVCCPSLPFSIKFTAYYSICTHLSSS